MNNSSRTGTKTIAVNKRARFEYHVEERFEAGIALEGWEVKALREGRVQFADSYVLLKDNEAFLFGCQINPLPTASTHVTPDPTRTRKLLLHRQEIDRLAGAVERKGYTLIPLRLYWKRGTTQGALASSITGFVVWVLMEFFGGANNEIDSRLKTH